MIFRSCGLPWPRRCARYLVGAIANASTHKNLLGFVEESGVLLLCTALNSRVYFTEHFPLVLELARVLSATPSRNCSKESAGERCGLREAASSPAKKAN